MASDTTAIVLAEAHEHFEMPNLGGDIVPIQVGIETSLLHVHSAVLTRSSSFLKNAMKPGWRTDATKPIDMSDVGLTVFEGYCRWLYTGRIICHEKDQCYIYLASLYVLGEMLMDAAFQDVIVAAIIRYSQGYLVQKKPPGNTVIKIIYAGTPVSSPARRLLVDFWVFNALPTWKGFPDLITHTCPDFVDDLVGKLVAKREVPNSFLRRPWIANPESYRVGSSNETKSRSLFDMSYYTRRYS